MRYVSMFTVVLLVALTVPLAAQKNKTTKDTTAAREELRAEMKALVTENMELTESEANAFWPLYDEYQTKLDVIGDRMTRLIESYGATHKVMTDDTAAKLIRELLSIQADRVKLQEEYLPRFEKVLPITKVARYYQIENKFRTAVDYEITSKIPLVE